MHLAEVADILQTNFRAIWEKLGRKRNDSQITFLPSYPTDLNPKVVIDLLEIRRPPDCQALKLWKGPSGRDMPSKIQNPTKCFTFWCSLVWRKNNLNLTEKQLFSCCDWLSKALIDVVWLPQASIDEFFRPQKCETFGRETVSLQLLLQTWIELYRLSHECKECNSLPSQVSQTSEIIFGYCFFCFPESLLPVELFYNYGASKSVAQRS